VRSSVPMKRDARHATAAAPLTSSMHHHRARSRRITRRLTASLAFGALTVGLLVQGVSAWVHDTSGEFADASWNQQTAADELLLIASAPLAPALKTLDDSKQSGRIAQNRNGRPVQNGGAKPADRERRDDARRPSFGPDGARGPRPISQRDIERFLEVAHDIDPNWATKLRQRIEENPEETSRAIEQKGRRFMGLVMLREKDEALYKAKIRELDRQGKLRKAQVTYFEAKDAASQGQDREEDVQRAKKEIADLAKQLVDDEIRTRGLELAAMTRLLDEFREQLEADSQPASTARRAEQLLHRKLNERPAPGLEEMLDVRVAPMGIEAPSSDAPQAPKASPRRQP